MNLILLYIEIQVYKNIIYNYALVGFVISSYYCLYGFISLIINRMSIHIFHLDFSDLYAVGFYHNYIHNRYDIIFDNEISYQNNQYKKCLSSSTIYMFLQPYHYYCHLDSDVIITIYCL